MPQISDNLLVSLEKWAHRQRENFLTDAFAHLLISLLRCDPVAGCKIIVYLSGGRLVLGSDQAADVGIVTQMQTEVGQPDLAIKHGDYLLLVEIKDSAKLGWEQISRYRQVIVSQIYCAQGAVVLLTRHPAEIPDAKNEPDEKLRWHSTARLLDDLLEKNVLSSELGRYLACQFVEFLTEKEMAMEHVGWEMKNGVAAAMNLVGMIGEALSGLNKKPALKSVGQKWAGYYDTGKKKIWVGFMWNEPTRLMFQVLKCDPAKAKKVAAKDSPGDLEASGVQLFYYLDLADEDVHFFSLGRDSQAKRIEKFVSEGLVYASKVDAVNTK